MNSEFGSQGSKKKTYEVAITLERDHMTRDEAIVRAARMASQLTSIGLSGEVRVSDTDNHEIIFLSRLLPN